MNKKKQLIVFLLFLSVVILLVGIWKKIETNPTNVFHKSIKSIVELKVVSATHGENYGTAVFLDEEGLLVTNSHIVTYTRNGKQQPYEEICIRFATEEEYREVELVKFDTDLDLAVLQLKDMDASFRKINMGDSEGIEYGQKVYAIGNTLNYGISITEGIVSNNNIEIEDNGVIHEVIQADLNITPGNSGGALLDTKGRIIGITSFRTKTDDGNIAYGLAYSIPIKVVMEYVYE